MTTLFDRISSYNLFNYLVPGALFAVCLETITEHTITLNNVVIDLFIWYFIGLVISRVGSLVVEPALRKIGFIERTEYSEYVAATASDRQIQVLLEASNMYRTLLALFAVLFVVKITEPIILRFGVTNNVMHYAGLGALMILFGVSYRKQTRYIVRRVKIAIGESEAPGRSATLT